MKTQIPMSKELEQSLWRVVDEARGEMPMAFVPIVRHLRKRGQELSIGELMYLQQRVDDYAGPFVVPPSVAQFFGHLVHSRQCNRVLDPAGGLGLLGAWLADAEPRLRIDVVSRDAAAEEMITPFDLKGLTLNVGSLESVKGRLATQYDAIIASGPVGLKSENRTYQSKDGSIDLNDDPSCLLIADVAEFLSRDGFIAFVMSPRFAFEDRPRSVRRNLEQFDLHLSALLTFRPGVFAGTSIAFDLAIIERTRHETLFVAEVPEDFKAQGELVARLWARDEGKTPGQGRLVSEKQFHGLATLEAKERAGQLAKGKGLDAIPFSRVVEDVRAPKRQGTEFERCDDHPDAVYLPEMATTAATTRQEELPPRLKSYLQLVVNQKIVLPEYLAEWLNTPMGHAVRQSAMTGTYIPRINKNLLRESMLYLAPLADQRRALEAVSDIQRLRSELSELESRVWERPRQVGEVIETLHKVNHEERFEEWLESLPFPLASILRSYHALDQTDKDKYERLLYFFEAFTIFCALVHLSAFKSSEIHWQAQKDRIARVLGDQHLSFERPTFGLWRAVVELLTAELRRMLNGKDEDRVASYSLYSTADPIPLEMLSSKELLGQMQRVNSFRNRWTGHGGAVTAAEAAERHEHLKKELAKLREIVSTKFLRYQLIQPREAEILAGPIFRCRVRRVMGSNPQLEHQTVEVMTPAKTGVLYLYNPGHSKVLELIPLVQVRDTPQPASYFYNRVEEVELHLVSYHFADQSEVSDQSDAVTDLLNEFRSKETGLGGAGS